MQGDERESIHERLWKSQKEEPMQMTTEEVRARARAYERENVLAHWLLLALGTLGAAAFGYNMVQFRGPWIRVANVSALGALSYFVWRLTRNGPRRIGPAEPCVRFLEREFQGKRQTLLEIRRLVLLLFPCLVASWWAGGPVASAKSLWGFVPPRLLWFHGIEPLIVGALVLALVWFACGKQARKVEREIEKLGGE